MIERLIRTMAVRLALFATVGLAAGCGSAAASSSATTAASSSTTTAASSGPSTAAAAGPHTVTGHPLTLVAAGVPTPTSFAWGDGRMFIGGAGNGRYQLRGGGVYVLRGDHRVRKLAGSPTHIAGMAWHDGALYLSGDRHLDAWQLYRWSGWNGSQFTNQQTIYTAPNTLQALNGIGFGADGRLYVGVGVGDDDNGPTTNAFARDILSFNSQGGDLQVFATGIRQPWQMAFPAGSSSPYVSDPGPDDIPSQPNPPDLILRVRPGQNYGFPSCDWDVPSACASFAKPLRLLAPHTDAFGLAIMGNRLYFNEYGGHLDAKIAWMPLSGGRIHTVAVGFNGYTVGFGAHHGRLYVGQTRDQIYSFTP
jgi:glucose/arabinose dehydrogenase